MQKPLSSHDLSEIEAFIGMRLIQCMRTDWQGEDVFDLPENEKRALKPETESVCLVFANGRSLEFYPFTEKFSLKYALDVDTSSQQRTDVSGDRFWKNRIGSSITQLKLMHSNYRKEPYAIRFELSNGLHVELQYDGDDDALIICTW